MAPRSAMNWPLRNVATLPPTRSCKKIKEAMPPHIYLTFHVLYIIMPNTKVQFEKPLKLCKNSRENKHVYNKCPQKTIKRFCKLSSAENETRNNRKEKQTSPCCQTAFFSVMRNTVTQIWWMKEILALASTIVTSIPKECNCRAAVRPEIPEPTTITLGDLFTTRQIARHYL